MRITSNMMTRNYLSGLNSALTQYATASKQMTSGLRNDRISGNVRDEISGLRVTRQMDEKEQYLTNIRDAQSELDVAENSLTSISDVLLTAIGKVESGMSDDKAVNGRPTIATTLDNWQNQIIQFANTQYQEKKLLNGVKNSIPPFSLDKDKGMLYHDIEVDKIKTYSATGPTDPNLALDGKYVYEDGTNPDGTTKYVEVPEAEDIYIDLGMGVRLSGSVADPTTAFKLSVDGLKCLGFGTNDDGTSKNVVNILRSISEEFKKTPEDYDRDSVNKNFKALQDGRQNLVVNIAEVGTRGNFLDTTADRIEADLENLTKLQQKLLVVSDTEQATTIKQLDYLMNLNLSFGSKFLPMSLMDYLR